MAKHVKNIARVKVGLTFTLEEFQTVETIRELIKSESNAKAIYAVFNRYANDFIKEYESMEK